MAHGSAS
ncbi:hypothetical protein DSL72_003730 [Monilinia vaccinii-corymbosi]|nr:hypothetical protein DSL72_003730 [Monilinia vaccinii-corymbosi]